MPVCDEKRVLLCFSSMCDALNDHGATYCCPEPRNTFTTVLKIIRKLVYFLSNSALTLFFLQCSDTVRRASARESGL